MEERVVLEGAPVAPIKRLPANEIERTRDRPPGARAEDEQHMIGEALAEQTEEMPVEIGRAPFAPAGVHVELEEGVPVRLGEVAAGDPFDLDAGFACRLALAPDRLALA